MNTIYLLCYDGYTLPEWGARPSDLKDIACRDYWGDLLEAPETLKFEIEGRKLIVRDEEGVKRVYNIHVYGIVE
jgi:hypothetical protein